MVKRKVANKKPVKKKKKIFFVSGSEKTIARRLLADYPSSKGLSRLSTIYMNYNSLRRMIWNFRSAHGWKFRKDGTIAPKGYFGSVLRSYQKLKVNQEQFEVVRFLSSRLAIDAIRQRGRMRQKPGEINKREIKKLQDEMNALLRWIFHKS